MSFIDAFFASPLAARLGWVFLHFLWQGALIAGMLWIVITALGKPRARARYLASCVALTLMLVAPVATFCLVARSVIEIGQADSLPALLAALEREAGAMVGVMGAENTDWRALVPALALFWILGALVQQARLLHLWWGTERLRNAFQLPLPISWQDTVAAMRTRLGIRVPVRAVESAAAEVPTVVGWLSPIILVPTSALLQLSAEQLRMVLAHELAHIRRHDYLVNLIQTTVEALLFFHPAVWWISHRLRVEREYCCDDIAVELGGDALTYARALERLETLRSPSSREPRPLVLASNGGSLMERIQRLVKPESTARKSLTLSFLPAVVLLAGALSSTAFGFVGNVAASQDEKEMSDDELAQRIAELRVQIDRLESKLGHLRDDSRQIGQANLRFGGRGPRHEVHADRDVRRFDLRFGDGQEHTFEVHVPEIHVPEIHVPEIHVPEIHVPKVFVPRVQFGTGESGRFKLLVPELRFGQDGGKHFQFHLPQIDLHELQGKVDVQLRSFGKQMEEFNGQLRKFDFHFGDDFDPAELHERIQKDIHEHLEGGEWKRLHEGGLYKLRELNKDINGSFDGLKFLLEIESDESDGSDRRMRGYRWSSENGAEPEVWYWRSGADDDHEEQQTEDAGDGAGIDWKLYNGSRDA